MKKITPGGINSTTPSPGGPKQTPRGLKQEMLAERKARLCPLCGSETGGSVKKVYCSRSCRNRAYQGRIRAKLDELEQLKLGLDRAAYDKLVS